MNAATVRRALQPGPAGAIELLVDEPPGAPLGVAVIAHPQPLLGGSAQHKVPHTLARAARDAGWAALRPNFRGVGASEGVHDFGEGESADLLAVVEHARARWTGRPLVLAGFSFGAFVQARVATELAARGVPAARVMLAGLPDGAVADGRVYATGPAPAGTDVIHGEQDERVPLANALAWAGRHGLVVLVAPGTDHFFTGRQPILREWMQHGLALASPQVPGFSREPPLERRGGAVPG